MRVVSSRCSATASGLIYACLQPQNNNSSSVGKGKVNRISYNAAQKPQKLQKKQPSVAEMERAIGAGMFRDSDTSAETPAPSLFDILSSTPLSQPESAIEKKLRETGEWVIEATEGPSRSGGHGILMVVCLGILPVWLFFLAIASGIIKLPFDVPMLDDWIM